MVPRMSLCCALSRVLSLSLRKRSSSVPIDAIKWLAHHSKNTATSSSETHSLICLIKSSTASISVCLSSERSLRMSLTLFLSPQSLSLLSDLALIPMTPYQNIDASATLGRNVPPQSPNRSKNFLKSMELQKNSSQLTTSLSLPLQEKERCLTNVCSMQKISEKIKLRYLHLTRASPLA